jgi:hypothetical protein
MTAQTLAIVLAALALNAIPAGTAAAMTEIELSGTVKSDEVSSYRKRQKRTYRHWHVYEGPKACSSVMFPRSPLCAHAPATFSPYGDSFPYVWF